MFQTWELALPCSMPTENSPTLAGSILASSQRTLSRSNPPPPQRLQLVRPAWHSPPPRLGHPPVLQCPVLRLSVRSPMARPTGLMSSTSPFSAMSIIMEAITQAHLSMSIALKNVSLSAAIFPTALMYLTTLMDPAGRKWSCGNLPSTPISGAQ